MNELNKRIEQNIPLFIQDTLSLIKNAPEKFGSILTQEILHFSEDISKFNWEEVRIDKTDFGYIDKFLYIIVFTNFYEAQPNTNVDLVKYLIDTEHRYWNEVFEKQVFEKHLKDIQLFKIQDFDNQKIIDVKDYTTNKSLLNYTGWKSMFITLMKLFYPSYELISSTTDKKWIFKKIVSNSQSIYLVVDNYELKGNMNYGKIAFPQMHYIVLPDGLSDAYFKTIAYEDFFLDDENDFLFTMTVINPMIRLKILNLSTFATVVIETFNNSPNLIITNHRNHPHFINNTIEMLLKKHIYFYMDLITYLAPPLESFISKAIE